MKDGILTKHWRIRLCGWGLVQPTEGALTIVGFHMWAREFHGLRYPDNLDPLGAA